MILRLETPGYWFKSEDLEPALRLKGLWTRLELVGTSHYTTPQIQVYFQLLFLFLTMKNQRLPSIDILRAVTMLLMIFVNDLWSLTKVPRWLLHTAAEEDGMGLSDVVFPAFLFIVGLSIPHAVKARLEKGASKVSVMLHILSRSFALLLMGLFMVNLENIDAAQLLIRKEYWQILMALAFVLIWNNYRSPMVFGVVPTVLLKILGWLILAFLASIYQGASVNWMMIHWWGILGLIGWAYLLVIQFTGLLNRVQIGLKI